MTIDRRSLLQLTGMMSLASITPRVGRAADDAPTEKADYTLRIGTGLIELAPQHIVSTTLYNGQFPGPLIRFKEGQRVVLDIYNDTDRQSWFIGMGR
jgi:FtsP/CotA-like multicopper oxidase with cupredoxin domain